MNDDVRDRAGKHDVQPDSEETQLRLRVPGERVLSHLNVQPD